MLAEHTHAAGEHLTGCSAHVSAYLRAYEAHTLKEDEEDVSREGERVRSGEDGGLTSTREEALRRAQVAEERELWERLRLHSNALEIRARCLFTERI